MNRLDFRRWPLAVKITLSITFMVTLAVLTVTILALRREQAAFHSEQEEKAKLQLEILEEVVADPLYTLDADFIQEIIQELEESDLLLVGRVYDAEGRLVADSSRVGMELVFGVEPDPLGQQLVAADSTYYDWQSDRLVSGQAVTAGRQRLGAVSIEISTKEQTHELAEVRREGLIAALLTIVVGTVLALLLSRSITLPLHDLVDAARRVAEGNLTQKIAVGPRVSQTIDPSGRTTRYVSS